MSELAINIGCLFYPQTVSFFLSTQNRSISRSELAGHQVELPQSWVEFTQQALQRAATDASVPGQVEDV